MSTKYKFMDNDGIYFVSFATVSWVDVLGLCIMKYLWIVLDIVNKTKD
jgi:hypothetical protein